MITYAQRQKWAAAAKEARDKIFARSQVTYALKTGVLTREPCYCGETKVEGHHPDYSKPLEVIWACKKHHAELDKMRRDAHVRE